MTVPWSIIEFIVRQILPDPPIMLPCAKKFSPLGTRAILKSPPFFPGGGGFCCRLLIFLASEERVSSFQRYKKGLHKKDEVRKQGFKTEEQNVSNSNLQGRQSL